MQCCVVCCVAICWVGDHTTAYSIARLDNEVGLIKSLSFCGQGSRLQRLHAGSFCSQFAAVMQCALSS